MIHTLQQSRQRLSARLLRLRDARPATVLLNRAVRNDPRQQGSSHRIHLVALGVPCRQHQTLALDQPAVSTALRHNAAPHCQPFMGRRAAHRPLLRAVPDQRLGRQVMHCGHGRPPRLARHWVEADCLVALLHLVVTLPPIARQDLRVERQAVPAEVPRRLVHPHAAVRLRQHHARRHRLVARLDRPVVRERHVRHRGRQVRHRAKLWASERLWVHLPLLERKHGRRIADERTM